MKTALLARRTRSGRNDHQPGNRAGARTRECSLALRRYSAIGHTNEATAVARWFCHEGIRAIPSAATALPALNPYHPTQASLFPPCTESYCAEALVPCRNPAAFQG